MSVGVFGRRLLLVLALVLVVAPAPGVAGADTKREPLDVRCPVAGVSVYVDGVRVGVTPFSGHVTAKTNKWVVALVQPDRAPLRRTVLVRPASRTVADLPEPEPQPWARVSCAAAGVVAGWMSDEFGLFDEGRAPPGPGHGLLWRKGSATQELGPRTLSADEEVRLEPGAWAPRPAILDTTEVPDTMTVTVDGRRVRDGQAVAPGRHSVAFVDSRSSKRCELDVTPEQRVVRLRLPLKSPAVDSALAWLVGHQFADGRWSSSSCPGKCAPPCRVGQVTGDTGTTGLALLALVEALNGPIESVPAPQRTAIAKGVDFLLKCQAPDGCFQKPGNRNAAFGQPIALLALLHVWAATGDERIPAAATRAFEAMLSARTPSMGWRYAMPSDGDSDTAVTGWCALASATAVRWRVFEDPFGDLVSQQRRSAAMSGVSSWLMRMEDPATRRIGYQVRGGGRAYLDEELMSREEVPGAWSMTGLGALATRLASEPGDVWMIEPLPTAQALSKHPPDFREGKGYDPDVHAAYFGARFLRLTTGALPAPWRTQIDAMKEWQGPHGSFVMKAVWSDVGGAVFTTSMAALTLEVAGRE